jgi:sigma-B regulation protein RsbU (phosphoserine phosphatase)
VAEDPGMLLTRINRDIFSMLQQTSEVMFATGLYMICDLSIPAVRFARAGHHEPLLLRPSVQSVAPIAFNKNDVQSALGLFENEQYHSQEFPIQPGDFILNFTDGLFEVTDVNNREFGMDNLCRTCEKHLALEPEAFLDSVLEEVCAFSSTGRFSDDVCILGLKVR